MNLKFKFDCEEQWTIVEMPPNLMLALSETKKERLNSIFLYLILTILSVFLYTTSIIKIIPFFYGPEYGFVFMILSIVFGYFLGKWCINKTPEAIKLFCCIMIKDFDKYIDNIIEHISRPLSHKHMIYNTLSRRKIRKLEKIIISAQLLKEIYFECLEGNYDLHENIDFVENNIYDIYGFNIKRIKYENFKRKKNRGRGSVVSFCGSKHHNR